MEIHKLGLSLLLQTNQNFEWLIFDDFSDQEYDWKDYKHFIDTNRMQVFRNSSNLGKAKTLNVAFDYCSKNYPPDTLLVVVDDDDLLYKGGMKIIEDHNNAFSENLNVGGIFFQYELFSNSKIVLSNSKKKFISVVNENENKPILANRFEWSNMYDTFDGVNAFYVRAINENRFTDYPNESYIGITTILFKMALDGYRVAHVSDTIGEAHYQEQGLTKKGKIYRMKNYKGMIEYSLFRSDKRYNSTKNQIKYLVNMWAYAFEDRSSTATVRRIKQENNIVVNSFLEKIAIAPGYLLNFRWSSK